MVWDSSGAIRHDVAEVQQMAITSSFILIPMNLLSDDIIFTIFQILMSGHHVRTKNRQMLQLRHTSRRFTAVSSRGVFWNSFQISHIGEDGLDTQITSARKWYLNVPGRDHTLTLKCRFNRGWLDQMDMYELVKLFQDFAPRWEQISIRFDKQYDDGQGGGKWTY
jgi:hypothetical protein